MVYNGRASSAVVLEWGDSAMVEGLSVRQPRSHPALRYGLPSAVAIAVLGGADVALQARRHAIGPSARGLVVFSYLFVLVVVVLLLAVGFLAAGSNGRLRAGMRAGAVAASPPSALFMLVVVLQTIARQGSPSGTQIAGDVIAFLLFFVAGALAGAIVSLPGALVGCAHYRGEHAAELAALTAERAAQRAAQRAARREAASRPKEKTSPREWAFVWLVIAAIVVIVVAPDFAAELAYDAFTLWQGLLLAAGALAVGAALLKSAGHVRWLGYVFDWLGVMALCFAVVLAIAEVTGYGVYLLSAPAVWLFMWRTADRYMGDALPRPPERPEQSPVFFRHDGEAIVIYPSRRKLAAHGTFAGGVALICSVLAVVFRGAGPTLVFALGAFAVMGLIGFIPDVARLVYRRPALIVNSDGITDLASAGVFGFGLIPWHEVAGIFNAGSLRTGSLRELAIYPVSFRRLLARQPLLKRPFLRFFSALGGGGIFISSIFLSQPPAEVAQRIHEYVKAHAPAGFMEPDEDEDEREHGKAGVAAREA